MIASLASPGLWLLRRSSQWGAGDQRAEKSEVNKCITSCTHSLQSLPDSWPPSASTQPLSGSPLFPQSLLGLWLASLLHPLTPPGWGELLAPRCYQSWVLYSPLWLLSHLSHDLARPLLNFVQILLWASYLFPVRTSTEEETKLINQSFHPLTFPALSPQTVTPPQSPWHFPLCPEHTLLILGSDCSLPLCLENLPSPLHTSKSCSPFKPPGESHLSMTLQQRTLLLLLVCHQHELLFGSNSSSWLCCTNSDTILWDLIAYSKKSFSTLQ